MAKKVNKTDQQLANVEQAFSKTEQFIETNQKKKLESISRFFKVF